MATNRDIIIDVKARTAEFRRDMDKAERKTKTASQKIAGNFNRIKNSISGMQVALAGIAAATALAAVTKKSIDAADAIAKAASKANIASDTYQEMVFALDKFDVSQERVNTGLGAFTKRLGEARNGTGALTTFLRKYDESLLDTLKSANSNEEALEIFIKRLSEVENDADRAALAAAAFSRSAGIDMANALKDGGQGLEQWRQRAKDLGIIIDEDLLKKSEDAKDALATLETVIKTRAISAFAELSPQVKDLADMLVEAQPALDDIADTIGDIASFAISAATGIAELESKFGLLNKTINAIPLVKTMRDIAAVLEVLGESDGPKRHKMPPRPKTVEVRSPGNTSGGKDPEDTSWILGDNEGLLDKTAGKVGLINGELEESISKMSEVEAVGKKAMDTVSYAAESAGWTISSAFEDAIFKAESLSDVVKGLADDLARMIFRETIGSAISSGVSSFVGSFGGGKASGGPVSAGMTYLVGERGPELLHMGGNGNITPNHGLKGGGDVVVNVINEGNSKIETSSRKGPDGQTMIDVMVKSSFDRLAGSGQLDRTMKSNYGVARPGRF